MVTRDPADLTGELWDGDGLGLLPSFFGPPVAIVWIFVLGPHIARFSVNDDWD